MTVFFPPDKRESPARFMTLEDVCDTLDVSPAVVYGLVRSGNLPAIQVGPKKVWRIEHVRFEHWVRDQYVLTQAANAMYDEQGLASTAAR